MMTEYPVKIGKSNARSKSMRVTVPPEVGKWLDISIGDDAKWIIEIKDDKVQIKFEKV